MADTSTLTASIATTLAWEVAKDIFEYSEQENSIEFASSCSIQTTASTVSAYLKSADFKSLQVLCDKAGFILSEISMTPQNGGDDICEDRIHNHQGSTIGIAIQSILTKK